MQQSMPSTSLEAIKYQGKSLFFQDLILAFTRLQEMGDFTTNGLIEVGIDGIVKRHTNMTVAIEAQSGGDRYYNAMAKPPVINQNSPFYAFVKGLGGASFIQEQRLNDRELKAFQSKLTALVDREKGTVDGVISKIPMRVQIGAGILAEFPPEQVAACVLHEVGHLYTYFEQIVETTSSNLVVAAASEALAATEDSTLRLELIHQYERIVGQKLGDTKGLSEMKLPSEGYAAVLIKDGIQQAARSSVGSTVYDIRASEFAADHYMTMHGAATAQILALDKIYQIAGVEVRQSNAAWFRTEVAKVVGVLAVTLLAPLVRSITKQVWVYIFSVLTSSHVEHRQYDLPRERLMRIRGNLIQVIKNQGLTGSDREAVLTDIDMLDDIAAEMVDRRSFLNWFWISLTSGRRGNYKQAEFQKELEAVINNNIFVSAGKLNQLTAQGAK